MHTPSLSDRNKRIAHIMPLLAAMLVIAAGMAPLLAADAEKGDRPMINLPTNRKPATAFPEGFTWFNTDRPLTFENDLKGRVVVVDFWTYCCINCIHMLPNLAKVEERFKNDPVVVIGCHSNKFVNESEAVNIRTAILRYRIKHPVIVDEKHRIWQAYGVRSWPTLMFIDAESNVVGGMSGEVAADTITQVVTLLLEEGRKKGVLADGPPTLRPEAMVRSASGLAFPGKVLADESADRIFIADSNHHRIVVADLAGSVLDTYGTGAPGLRDGKPDEARFENPQGMAYDKTRNLLYVADTDSHAIREINLKNKTVGTLAGTGKQRYDLIGGGVGSAQGLNSPWALALNGRKLYIAMAGPHQLWSLDLDTGITKAWVGSGREDILDGPADEAALAQPSALALHGGYLYFADSEVSAVRRVNLRNDTVETLIGKGLFAFGDQDGPFEQAKLQHAIGITADDDGIYVADTYNHKIKRINRKTRTIETLIGTGKPHAENGDSLTTLYEPGGLSVSGSNLYIADTNNHRILVYNKKTRKARELVLRGLTPKREKDEPGDDTAKRPAVKLAALSAKSDITFRFDIKLPDKVKLNPLAPMTLRLTPTGKNARVLNTPGGMLQTTLRSPKLPATFRVPTGPSEATGSYDIDLTFATCTTDDAGLCVPVHLRWRADLLVATTDAAATVVLTDTVSMP